MGARGRTGLCAVRGPGVDDLGVDRTRHARGDGVHGVMLASLINHTEHDTPEQMLIIMFIVWGRDRLSASGHRGANSGHMHELQRAGVKITNLFLLRRRAHGQMSK